VAKRAAEAGVDLTFLRTIPGTIGGAVRMNAGCYGRYVADVFVSAEAVTRGGERVTLTPADLGFGYRHADVPAGTCVISATFEAPPGDPHALAARMEEQLARRDASQPTKDRTAGSTFRNPVGHSSTGEAGESHELKAWKVIEDAGLRGARLGGAVMNEKHPNFLTNAGGATAAELERLARSSAKRYSKTAGFR
jgi:UDP-N-acetylmuramate dehydrogenase